MPAIPPLSRLLLPLVLALGLLAGMVPPGVFGGECSLSWAQDGGDGDVLVGQDDLAADGTPWLGSTDPEDVDAVPSAAAIPAGARRADISPPVAAPPGRPPGPRFPTGPPVIA